MGRNVLQRTRPTLRHLPRIEFGGSQWKNNRCRRRFAQQFRHDRVCFVAERRFRRDMAGTGGVRIRGSAIDQLQFFTSQAGWAAGETLYPLPRDPFFLVTTDGGASWHQRPVGEEDLPGAVQRFWFDSEQRGEVIIDGGKAAADGRYLSYESETGGESWSLHGKSDQLPKLRRAPPLGEDPGWRTHASKDGKALQIEHHSGGEWTPVASFLIEVATCRDSAGEGGKSPSRPPRMPERQRRRTVKDKPTLRGRIEQIGNQIGVDLEHSSATSLFPSQTRWA